MAFFSVVKQVVTSLMKISCLTNRNIRDGAEKKVINSTFVYSTFDAYSQTKASKTVKTNMSSPRRANHEIA